MKTEKYKEKHFKLTAYNILHMVTNFEWTLKTHQNKPIEVNIAINNVISYSFGFHTNCHNIGNRSCHFDQSDYKSGFKNSNILEKIWRKKKKIYFKEIFRLFLQK